MGGIVIPSVNPYTLEKFKTSQEALAWYENQKTDHSEFEAYKAAQIAKAQTDKETLEAAKVKLKEYYTKTVGLTDAEADVYLK